MLHTGALLLHQLVEQGISGRVFPENSLEPVNCKEGVDVGVTFDYVADEAYLLVFDGEVQHLVQLAFLRRGGFYYKGVGGN